MAFPSVQSFLFVLLVCIIGIVHCRHVHCPHMHKQVRRDATISASSESPIPSLGPDTAALLEDVTSIEEGLTTLPRDIYEFLQEVDDRLQQQEALLASLISVFAPQTETTDLSVLTTSTLMLSVSADSALSEPTSDVVSASTTSPPRSIVIQTLTRTTRVSATNTAYTLFSNSTSIDMPSEETSTANTAPSMPTPSTLDTTVPETPDANTTASSESTVAIQSAPSASSSPYVFKKTRESNVAVYYGQTPTTKTGGLMDLCQNENVDIVVLAFVSSFFVNGGFPTASFGPSCKGSTTAQQLHAPGLQDCTGLAPEIASCQALGKPVLVSLGGYYANVTFTSDSEAMQLAKNLWDLFGAGTGLDADLRPFGPDIIINGFDLDNESHDPTSYATFASSLRTLFDSDPTRKYYLSAAPQCPRPDASIPLEAMAHCDFVFVQFYNNPACNLDSPGFEDSFTAWSSELARLNNETRLFVGAAGFEGAGSGYVEGDVLGQRIGVARQYYVDNLGGVMVWDGTEARANLDRYGNDYLTYVKGSLE